ncbi:MAG TPA: hypothetical protein DEB36_02530, partial [Porphyromonadaceae bacterium]|nr:hypothetical protein [Porphyromonadaceae bacterium]
TGIKQSEEGNELIIRMVEIEGKATTATINLPVAATSARRLNLIEMPLQDVSSPTLQGTTLSVQLKPHEIATIGIKP